MPQNGINHPGVTALAQAFAINPLLRVINLNDNTFTEKGAMAMAKVRGVQQGRVGRGGRHWWLSLPWTRRQVAALPAARPPGMYPVASATCTRPEWGICHPGAWALGAALRVRAAPS